VHKKRTLLQVMRDDLLSFVPNRHTWKEVGVMLGVALGVGVVGGCGVALMLLPTVLASLFFPEWEATVLWLNVAGIVCAVWVASAIGRRNGWLV